MASRKSKHRKNRPSQKFTHFLNLLYWVLAVVAVLAAVGIIGYYSGYNDGLDESAYMLQQEKNRADDLESRLKQITIKSARHEYDDQPSNIKKPPKGPKRTVFQNVKKPKLAIIIDDVSFRHDVENIKALGLTLTMSFLPPSPRHPDSAKLAAKEPFYMVHVPMEAQNYKGEEPVTLHAGDSKEKIEAYVLKLRELFPKARYFNNHTGSKFTADEDAMNKLMYALNSEHISFIDSRTTSKTKVPVVMKNLGLPYIARDVFLDHDPEVEAIKKQIKRAIRIAKKHGSAIAIGHPHKKTLQALRESKELFGDVDLIRIDDYY